MREGPSEWEGPCTKVLVSLLRLTDRLPAVVPDPLASMLLVSSARSDPGIMPSVNVRAYVVPRLLLHLGSAQPLCTPVLLASKGSGPTTASPLYPSASRRHAPFPATVYVVVCA